MSLSLKLKVMNVKSRHRIRIVGGCREDGGTGLNEQKEIIGNGIHFSLYFGFCAGSLGAWGIGAQKTMW